MRKNIAPGSSQESSLCGSCFSARVCSTLENRIGEVVECGGAFQQTLHSALGEWWSVSVSGSGWRVTDLAAEYKVEWSNQT